ncbi:hypothetical protein VP01_2719g7 [Puccinia sorghi]|uniref:DDE Tnp4 domain-containing protein n=1 Tax=Puccinia sorghi TaxID=27349 RepID=A0A0L6V3H4_9BASI|nr:hypothetical protein VP01_2719g7 [Puccinia sorghi]
MSPVIRCLLIGPEKWSIPCKGRPYFWCWSHQSEQTLWPCTSDSKDKEKTTVLDNIIDGATEVKILALLSVWLPLLVPTCWLCDAVANNPVFHNSSNHPQPPVVDQMMVAVKILPEVLKKELQRTITLKSFGCNGNGVAVGQLAKFFSELERGPLSSTQIGMWWQSWTSNPTYLLGQPMMRARRFRKDLRAVWALLMNCKGHYGMVTLFFCDQNKNILFLRLDHQSAQKTNTPCPTSKQASRLLFQWQIRLGQLRFHTNHKCLRVLVENCIGLLKTHFQSLKGLRLCVSSKQDLIRVTAWILVCPIITHFLTHDAEIY